MGSAPGRGRVQRGHRARALLAAAGLLLSALAIALPAAPALAGEEANAPTVTGETGLFSLLSGDTLPRGGWSFGLYYNNWDRVVPFDGPPPTDPGVGIGDPSLDPFTALFSGRAADALEFDDVIPLPHTDGDVIDLGHFPITPSVPQHFFVEMFKPSAAPGPQSGPGDVPPPLLENNWNELSEALGYGYAVTFGGGVDANASRAGESRFDLDGDGRRGDLALGQALVEGTPADVLVPPFARVRSAGRARASALTVLPVCSGRLRRFRGVFGAVLLFDPPGGSAVSARFRRHIGGTLAVNAPLLRTPDFGRGGRLSFEFAGCGPGHVEAFSTFHSLGLPRIVHGLRTNVAAALLDVRLDGRLVRHGVKIETARERSVRATRLWPNPPRGSSRDQVGLLTTISGRFDRARIGQATKARRLTLAPRAAAVGFVSRCLRRGRSPRLVRRPGGRTALTC